MFGKRTTVPTARVEQVVAHTSLAARRAALDAAWQAVIRAPNQEAYNDAAARLEALTNA